MARIAGISFMAAGILYLFNLATLASLGPLPSGGEAFLTFLHAHILVGQLTTALFFVVDVLLIIGFTGLYFATGMRSPTMVIATVLSVVALTVDEISNIVFLSYINLSNFYAAATSDSQRIAYGAVSDFASGIVLTFGESFFFILFSLVMVAICLSKGGLLSRPVRALGVVAGALGIVAGATGFFPLIILWPIWFLMLAYSLVRAPAS
jgi:hypothetical protein